MTDQTTGYFLKYLFGTTLFSQYILCLPDTKLLRTNFENVKKVMIYRELCIELSVVQTMIYQVSIGKIKTNSIISTAKSPKVKPIFLFFDNFQNIDLSLT